MKLFKSLLSLALSFLFIQVSAQDIKSTYKTEVEKLAKKKEVQDAFAYILEIDEQTIADMITLTEIPAPSFEEAEKGLVFAEMLRDAGADSVWIDEVGNVIALRKGKNSNKTIVIDAHLDTVFPIETDITVKQRGDTLYAPGIADANRSLAMSIALMKTLAHENIRTTHDLWFVGSVGEEGLGDLKGMKHLFREGGQKIDAFIAIDGGGIDGIVNGGIGSLRYRVTFKGSGGHSYGAFGIGNPHNALANAISSFVPKADQFTKEGIRTTYSVSVLGGGTSVNSIPYESWMLVDMRSESQERLQGIKKLFLESIEEGLEKENSIIRRGEALTVDIENVGDRPSGITDPGNPLVQQSMAVANYLTGNQPRLSSSSTNSNIAVSLGIPAVTIGRGGQAGGGHSLDEWFLNKDGYLGLQNALLLILLQGEY
ncbi:acetylornithine deacetylase/succinyldiaminopimelate desuccinylase-like deacylase [Belliella baltica DSM 15883]|uniref:Acetylornithine deacetylase/succinyldiaminopimelate desuccinylase-like deacylase n=1 Tax=Belliella baltica (strain DSM 15883 / CIP 108006 / LMG 21964 / BA134) TaxID=866536 RepID=I3Z0C3_BELBD|nr:M20/M25/M40 family metallo-hydrolase [Belliella baltica]AFL82691.1 acetylornithine deacetylase/succinyldiaminopimelate desuccinylase-like deacylase [Belliella baltica DSM 15883]